MSADEIKNKRMKAAKKEGGKLGVDLTGAAELGGCEFFVTTNIGSEGDLDCLMAAKAEMLQELTASVGVVLVSAGVPDLVATCVVPADKTEVCPANEWLAAGVKAVGGELMEGASALEASAIITPKEGLFSIKLKDELIAGCLEYLRSKGKLPADDGSDDDEYVWGDDDLGNF
jgi:hypothetical protein